MPPLFVISLVAGLTLLCLALAWLALRSRRSAAGAPAPDKRPPTGAPARPRSQPVQLSRDEADELLQNAREMARADPARAAQTMRRWLSDSES